MWMPQLEEDFCVHQYFDQNEVSPVFDFDLMNM